MRILEWAKEKLGEGDIFSAGFYERYNELVRGTGTRERQKNC
jgi:hypothetical protein